MTFNHMMTSQQTDDTNPPLQQHQSPSSAPPTGPVGGRRTLIDLDWGSSRVVVLPQPSRRSDLPGQRLANLIGRCLISGDHSTAL